MIRLQRETILLAVVVVLGIFIVGFGYAARHDSPETAGQFGDSFGVVTSLFSGLTLIFLISAVIIQREELKTVREERDDTRRLLQGQEQINLDQKNALERQLFSQQFYSLMTLIRDEYARLSQKPAGDGSASDYVMSSSWSGKILLQIAEGKKFPDDFQSSQIDVAEKSTYLCSLVSNCYALIEGSTLDEDHKSEYRHILFPAVDKQVIRGMLYIDARARLTHGRRTNASEIITLWDLERTVGTDLASAYNSIVQSTK